MTVAQRYRRQHFMSLGDLAREGHIGLMMAVDRFDPGLPLIEVRRLRHALTQQDTPSSTDPGDAFDVLLRFGLDGQAPRTLREIGGLYSLSRERIRQLQNQAITKLRAPLEAEGFDGEGGPCAYS